MTYKILNRKQVKSHLFVEVECTFKGGVFTIEIPMLAPKSLEEIDGKIKTACLSEIAILEDEDIVSNLLPNIPLGEDTPIV